MKYIENDEIKDGTMCWIGTGNKWHDIIVFQKVGTEFRAWFRQHRQTADEFRANGFALCPIPYPPSLPSEIIKRESGDKVRK